MVKGVMQRHWTVGGNKEVIVFLLSFKLLLEVKNENQN